MLFQRHHQSEEAHLPPQQPPVWVMLPVRIQLRLPSHKTPLSSAEALLSLPLTPQEVLTIEAHATLEHISVEAAFVEHLKIVISEHEKMKEIIRQIRQKYPIDTQVMIDIQPLGQMTQEWSQS